MILVFFFGFLHPPRMTRPRCHQESEGKLAKTKKRREKNKIVQQKICFLLCERSSNFQKNENIKRFDFDFLHAKRNAKQMWQHTFSVLCASAHCKLAFWAFHFSPLRETSFLSSYRVAGEAQHKCKHSASGRNSRIYINLCYFNFGAVILSFAFSPSLSLLARMPSYWFFFFFWRIDKAIIFILSLTVYSIPLFSYLPSTILLLLFSG